MKVKALHLDFHKKPKPVPWFGLLLVVIGGLALIWQANRQDAIGARKDVIDTRTEQLAERFKGLEPRNSREQSEPVSDEVASIELKQVLAPTIGLQVLESTWTNDIAYIRIDVATLEHVVKVDFEARNREAVLNLVDALSSNPHVQRVTLVRQVAKVTDPLRPVQSQVEFWWKEETP